jgi:hypothetical protein
MASAVLIAIDVPPHADVHAVYGALELGEKDRRWEFEEAIVGILCVIHLQEDPAPD